MATKQIEQQIKDLQGSLSFLNKETASAKAKNHADKVMKDSVTNYVARVKVKVPVKTGELRDHIKALSVKDHNRIYSTKWKGRAGRGGVLGQVLIGAFGDKRGWSEEHYRNFNIKAAVQEYGSEARGIQSKKYMRSSLNPSMTDHIVNKLADGFEEVLETLVEGN